MMGVGGGGGYRNYNLIFFHPVFVSERACATILVTGTEPLKKLPLEKDNKNEC